jgi:tRNA-5-methyluridine54 2-sulfurtransferase
MPAMTCHRCQKMAAIRMRQHRLQLCSEHFAEWIIEQTERTIVRFNMFTRADKLLVAVSGGKDSLSLWDVLWKLGYPADGMYINLGIESEGGYSDTSQEFAQRFANERGLNLRVVNVRKEFGKGVPQFARQKKWGMGRPCAVCGMIKRHIMNQAALEGGYTVLTTAHNLDDEAALLMLNTMNWNVSMLRRASPVLEAGGGLPRKAKPFCRFYERESAAYAITRGIEYVEEECPHAGGSTQNYYKELLNKMESEHTGYKQNFYSGFLAARKELFGEKVVKDMEAGQNCPTCGQPTMRGDECSFCAMLKFARENPAG